MKLIFSSNVLWSIYNFRLSLLTELKTKGFEIHAIGKKDKYHKLLESNGFITSFIEFDNNSKNPFKDLWLIYNYYKIYKKINPNIILHNSIKPCIYGTIAAGILKIPTLNNISGIGAIFINKSIYTIFAKFLYKFSQSFATHTFFQNTKDLEYFVNNRIISSNKTSVIPGSGVDVQLIKPVISNNNNNKLFNFIFIGRLIKDKGVIEMYNAAINLYKKRKDFQIIVLGERHKESVTCISDLEYNNLKVSPIFKLIGFTDNVYKQLALSQCFILPSYREGLSKSLVESGSVGIPSITTNVPGCNDVIIDGFNGLLVKPRNSKSLEDAMNKILNFKDSKISEMGLNARNHVISKFSLKRVNQIYIDQIERILY
ncbi:glycosyltransferase family 4 protein [Flavobacteriaceae bacterium]|nr:glycosyltransferase family 4 protein [Flavobacteriaceae bacterium]